MKVVTAQMMRDLDRRTINEVGIPGAVLMENAGRGAADCLTEYAAEALGGRVYVLAGSGNNGGDGHVIARVLHGWGVDVEILLLAADEKVTGDARIHLDVARRIGIPVTEFPERDQFSVPHGLLAHASLIVDALLGTGLSKEVTGAYADAIEAINESSAFILSVDLPSGLSSDTGKPLGMSVYADLTVTFGLPKVAHVTYPGLTYCGEVEVVDIGIPQFVVEEAAIGCELVETDDVEMILSFPRPVESHKGHFGHALILAGSRGLTGAGVMAAQAAERIGTGLVTLGCPAGISSSVEARLLGAMTLPLAEDDTGGFAMDAAKAALDSLSGKSALAIGPGLSNGKQQKEFVSELLAKADVPCVVDADALNCLAGNLEAIKQRKQPAVLTPHPGEMARLLEMETTKVQADRLGAVSHLAGKTEAICVLKGARTLIAHPDGRVYINPTGTPALAAGGTGDVLTGMIAGMLAQGMEPLRAAIVCVCLHGLAGEKAARKTGVRALTPGDLLEAISALLCEMENEGHE